MLGVSSVWTLGAPLWQNSDYDFSEDPMPSQEPNILVPRRLLLLKHKDRSTRHLKSL